MTAGITSGYLTSPRLKNVHWQPHGRPAPEPATTIAGESPAYYYGFDDSSNLTTLPAGGTRTYDNDGELTSTALSGTTVNYSYSADGERLTAKEGSATGCIRYLERR